MIHHRDLHIQKIKKRQIVLHKLMQKVIAICFSWTLIFVFIDSIAIIKVNSIDHYIDIENGSWGENDQNMTGWTLRRDLNKNSKIIYKFPDDFILKCQAHVRISFDEDIDQSCDTSSPVITYLINANGEEKASTIQTLQSL